MHHVGYSTPEHLSCQTSGYFPALAHLCISRLPSWSPVVGHCGGSATFWRPMQTIPRNVSRGQPAVRSSAARRSAEELDKTRRYSQPRRYQISLGQHVSCNGLFGGFRPEQRYPTSGTERNHPFLVLLTYRIVMPTTANTPMTATTQVTDARSDTDRRLRFLPKKASVVGVGVSAILP